jgi:hypothetical protein
VEEAPVYQVARRALAVFQKCWNFLHLSIMDPKILGHHLGPIGGLDVSLMSRQEVLEGRLSGCILGTTINCMVERFLK